MCGTGSSVPKGILMARQASRWRVLGIVYGAMQRETAELRRNALSRLADKAFDLLLRSSDTIHN